MVTVRLFASLRAAAGGQSVVTVDATTLAGIVAALGAEFGPVMSERLSVSKLVADGDVVDPDDDRDLSGATELVLLPPFSGG